MLARSLIILALLLLIFYFYYFQYSALNTDSFSLCSDCERYHIHRLHNDPEGSARLLEKVNTRNRILIRHLKQKYLSPQLSSPDPVKLNRIDVLQKTEIFDLQRATENEYIQERIQQLLRNYDSGLIYEISPLNNAGITSYTQNKRKLILCLRKKEPNARGVNELHDINTVMFVNLHELSHMMNDLWGHKMNFWILFKFMLTNAVECGIYKPVNYAQHPIIYCGLKLTYNPVFDPII